LLPHKVRDVRLTLRRPVDRSGICCESFASKDRVAGLEVLDPKAAAALSGMVNLRDYETQIDSLAETNNQPRQASVR